MSTFTASVFDARWLIAATLSNHHVAHGRPVRLLLAGPTAAEASSTRPMRICDRATLSLCTNSTAVGPWTT